MALQIVKSDSSADRDLIRRLEYIKENTSDLLKTNYFVVVHTVARRMANSMQTPIELRVSPRRTKEYELGELIAELEEAHININDIVREVAKNYSIDVPYGKSGEVTLPTIAMEKI